LLRRFIVVGMRVLQLFISMPGTKRDMQPQILTSFGRLIAEYVKRDVILSYSIAFLLAEVLDR
jgi:hypothetical protein